MIWLTSFAQAIIIHQVNCSIESVYERQASKVVFTISGEALFALFAKLLPIEDISIEESSRPKPTLAERAIAVTHQAKGSRRRSQVRLNQGINKDHHGRAD